MQHVFQACSGGGFNFSLLTPMAPKDKAESPPAEPEKILNIHQAMNKIMLDIGPIAKNKENTEQKYKFRGIDAAMDALNPLMGKYGVFPTTEEIETILCEEVQSKYGTKGTHLIRKYTFALNAMDGTKITTKMEGEAIDYGDKCVTKCQSVAFREMLYKTFVAPFEASIIDPQGSVDIEDENHDLKPDKKHQDNPPPPPRQTAPRTQAPAKAATPAPAKPQRLITEYGIKLNRQKWEDYWIIKLGVRQHEKTPDGKPQWTMENMWTYFDEMVFSLFGGRHIEQLTIDESRKLQASIENKLKSIIEEESVMRAKVQAGQTTGSATYIHNQPDPV